MDSVRKFNWVQRSTTWEYAQAWNAQRRKMTQRFLEEGAVAINGFATAQYNHTTGLVANAQQAAINRLRKSA